MTMNGLTRLVKQARQSAKEKATEWAERLGRPTSTGIATGAGLGTVLAAIGALKREGEKDPGVLTNPLLLGTIGATSGYLAGNAFERAPAKRNSRDMSLSALLGLAGGAGWLGSRLSKLDAELAVPGLKKEFDRLVTNGGLAGGYTPEGARIIKDLPATLTQDEVNEFRSARKKLSDTLRRAGRTEDAVLEGVYRLPQKDSPKSAGKFKDWWNVSNKSPKNIFKALNPLQFMREGRAATTTTPAVPGVTAGGSIKKFFGRMGKAMTHKSTATTARLAALAMLAGGGKAIYDYARD